MKVPKYDRVHLRRGGLLQKSFPTDSLVLRIVKKELFPTDQISVDGKTWIRLDQHKQLQHLFNGEGISHPSKLKKI